MSLFEGRFLPRRDLSLEAWLSLGVQQTHLMGPNGEEIQ